MKTDDIARALRNRTSKAATLAAYMAPIWRIPYTWRAQPPEARSTLRARLANLRSLPACYGTTLAEKYRHASTQPPLELSAPEAESPILWTEEDRPEVFRAYPGRDFLRHYGWYTDDDERETIEAYAVILKDFPHLIFEAIRDSMGDSLRVDLSTAAAIDYSETESDYNADEAREETAREAVRAADSTAERDAEEEREYQEQERHKFDLEEARADLASIRADFRRLRRDLRDLCAGPIPTMYPAAADAIRAQVKAILSRRSETLDTIAEHKQALA
jgi:hypothetical protein